MNDPFRDKLLAAGEELPLRVQQCAEPLRGEPAFDPAFIEWLARKIILPSNIHFEHPLLERAVRVGLAHIEATFQGDHPKYGTGSYAESVHDGFPPTIIAVVDALTAWGMMQRAQKLFSYWLHHFVRHDGSIDYYAPSLSEYGQLLTSARKLVERGGDEEWVKHHQEELERIARYLQERMFQRGRISLLKGVPEADEQERTATYFHNNAWVIRGITDWAFLLEHVLKRGGEAEDLRQNASTLKQLLLDAIHEAWRDKPDDWWLRPMLEEEATTGYWSRPQGYVTANRLGSYTNYRYWPELLSSGVLPHSLMERIVKARLAGGGQYLGMSRFMNHLDDWPLMDYLEGLWELGMHEDYLLCLWGHICYHQCEGHLTAYEQVTLPPGRKVADYSLPCQLVAVRAARRIVDKGHKTSP